MRCVRETLIQMNPMHVDAVREELANDEGYNKFTLFILDSYLAGETEQNVQDKLNLNLKSFKLFERNIEKVIFEFYGLEDKKVQDLIFSSIFYSLYSSIHESADARNKELEQLFHTMKQFEIEQVAAPILENLYEANRNTPLEAVYEHLYLKYNRIAELNNKLFSQLSSFNQTLGSYIKGEKSAEDLIKIFSSIQSLSTEADNNTARIIFQLSKLACLVFADQKQLLKEGEMGLGELLTNTNHGISKLPFGIDRFYLQNIYQHIYARHLENVDKTEIARFLLKKQSTTHLMEASNFNFPNQVSQKYINTVKPIQITAKSKLEKENNFLSVVSDQITNQSKINYLRGSLFSNILN